MITFGAIIAISASIHDEQLEICAGGGTRSPRPVGLDPGKHRVMAEM